MNGLDGSKFEDGNTVATGIHSQSEVIGGINGESSGQVDGDRGSGTAWSETDGSLSGLVRGENLETLQRGWIEERKLVELGIEGKRGVGKGLKCHAGCAKFGGAGAHLAGSVEKKSHGGDGLTLRINVKDLAGSGIGVREYGLPRDGIYGNAGNRR